MSADDLSGAWRGIFNYPGAAGPPTRFTATLRDAGGLLTGETTEPGLHGGALAARLDGRRTGSGVTFGKFYDDAGGGDYDSVAYRGEVDGEGLEITGRWTIPGGWSGSFIMVRERGKETAADLRAERKVG